MKCPYCKFKVEASDLNQKCSKCGAIFLVKSENDCQLIRSPKLYKVIIRTILTILLLTLILLFFNNSHNHQLGRNYFCLSIIFSFSVIIITCVRAVHWGILTLPSRYSGLGSIYWAESCTLQKLFYIIAVVCLSFLSFSICFSMYSIIKF